MKPKEKKYEFPCWCGEKKPLEKKMNVKALSKSRSRSAAPIMIDVFCHWCGRDGKVELNDDFLSEDAIRGDL